MANSNKLNKNVLVDLLKDDDVKSQIEALIVELLGKEKGAVLLLLLEQLQANQGTTTTEKKPWWKRALNTVMTFLPFLLKFFSKKAK